MNSWEFEGVGILGMGVRVETAVALIAAIRMMLLGLRVVGFKYSILRD